MKKMFTLLAILISQTSCGKFDSSDSKDSPVNVLKGNDILACNSYYFQSASPETKFYIGKGNSLPLDEFPSDKKTLVMADEFSNILLNVRPRLSASSSGSSIDRKYLELEVVFSEIKNSKKDIQSTLKIPSLQQGHLYLDMTIKNNLIFEGKSFDKVGIECDSLIK